MSEKKKHKGESIIGKIIYATLLFMPLMSIFVRSMYVVCNKNAYESYSGLNKTDATYTQITNKTQLKTGKQYLLKNTATTVQTTGTANNQRIYFEVENITNYSGNYNLYDATSVGLYSGSSTILYYYFYDENNNLIGGNPLTSNNNFEIQIKYISNNIVSNVLENAETLYSITYNDNNYLDGAFEYSIEKVEQNTMYNWTTSTGTYDVINRTTTGLGIQNSFVDLLLTYWILLTIIYIIYDIGLCLVMMAHRKVHSLIDSVD